MAIPSLPNVSPSEGPEDSPSSSPARSRRTHGDASRERILNATCEIASERGYEGTSISLVSERSGLPASSIYWHFENKDLLIAAVIERSFAQFAEKLVPIITVPEAKLADFRSILCAAAKTLLNDPHHLRFGLMLMMDRRVQELSGRRLFLQQRVLIRQLGVQVWEKMMPQLSSQAHRQLMVLTMAGLDGLFMAMECEDADFLQQIDLLAVGLVAAAEHLAKVELAMTSTAAESAAET